MEKAVSWAAALSLQGKGQGTCPTRGRCCSGTHRSECNSSLAQSSQEPATGDLNLFFVTIAVLTFRFPS